MEKFIVTKDIDIAHDMLKQGYQMISGKNSQFVFLNNNKLTFSGDKSRIIYTNILHI